MTDDTKSVLSGNGGRKAAIPVGSKHYEMEGVAFYLNHTPKEVLGSWVNMMISQLEQSGNFQAARQMRENPQPFAGNQPALAVFMAAAAEIEKLKRRIEALEKRNQEPEP